LTRFKLIGLVVAFVVLFIFLALPPLGAVTPLGMKTVGVLIFTIILWITEPVPIGVSCFLTLAMWVVVGALSYKDSFAYLGHYINLFLIGSFGIAGALYTTGAARRYALSMLNISWVRRSPYMLIMMFFFAACLLSSVTSNTATAIIFMSFALPLIEALGLKKGHSFAALLLMMVAFAGSVGGSGTPIGCVINPIIIGMVDNMFKYKMTFIPWTIFGYSIIIACTIVAYFVVRYINRPDVAAVKGASGPYLQDELRKMGPMTGGEKLAWAFLGLAIFLWVIPDPLAAIAPDLRKALGDSLNWGTTALIVAFIMCLVPINIKERKMLLTMRDWWAQTDLGVLSLVAVCMALGDILQRADMGISAGLTAVFQPMVAGLPIVGWILVMAVIPAIITNFMSNTAVAVMFTSIFSPLSASLKIGNPVAFAAASARSASMAIAFPSATTCTAVVYGSGYIPIPYGLRHGFLMMIPISIVTAFVGYYVAAAVFPWP